MIETRYKLHNNNINQATHCQNYIFLYKRIPCNIIFYNIYRGGEGIYYIYVIANTILKFILLKQRFQIFMYHVSYLLPGYRYKL